MFKRKKIGSSRTESPSMKVHHYLSGLILKIIFCIIVSVIIFLIFNYFIFNFINFILVNISQAPEITKENPYFIGIEIFAIILGEYMVIRDRIHKR
ncbi:MAG TPA: hypothetical protein DD381_03970 [Lentisphaeria bacterium]|nr:MAG: hypothetical protein A2X47_06660 [Lentisphaerae bacterium GWF2_38_69]HBM15487.1 hypothetical protein [Lentisphaeria bacterium]